MIRVRKAVRVLMSALREIFDEAAYNRFLERSHMASSRAAYAAFWRERESKRPKPRCC
jgi:hypothetical protein